MAGLEAAPLVSLVVEVSSLVGADDSPPPPPPLAVELVSGRPVLRLVLRKGRRGREVTRCVPKSEPLGALLAPPAWLESAPAGGA